MNHIIYIYIKPLYNPLLIRSLDHGSYDSSSMTCLEPPSLRSCVRTNSACRCATLAKIQSGSNPQRPKYLKTEVLGFHNPFICGLLNPRDLEYEAFGLVDVLGYGLSLRVWALILCTFGVEVILHRGFHSLIYGLFRSCVYSILGVPIWWCRVHPPYQRHA